MDDGKIQTCLMLEEKFNEVNAGECVKKNMKLWGIDSEAAEVVTEDEDEQELLRVCDPVHLVNLAKSYL